MPSHGPREEMEMACFHPNHPIFLMRKRKNQKGKGKVTRLDCMSDVRFIPHGEFVLYAVAIVSSTK